MNILIIGNGFDLAHNLPTKYTDFLKFISVVENVFARMSDPFGVEGIDKNILEIIKADMGDKRNNLWANEKIWKNLYENNYWLNLFYKNSFKENWIDFEAIISAEVQGILGKYFSDTAHDEGMLPRDIELSVSEYLSKKGIAHTRVKHYKLSDFDNCLYDDLKKLVYALELYLTKYISQIPVCNKLKCLDQISVDKILSFNYTDTYERVYDTGKMGEYCYIHGKADSSHNEHNSNIILGIDEFLNEQEQGEILDFVRFKKFYQRIWKATDSSYLDWSKEMDSNNDAIHELYIIGHSLDFTDRDVLRELILHDNVKTHIFYYKKDEYDFEDLQNKTANLIKVIGERELIRRTGGKDKRIVFELLE